MCLLLLYNINKSISGGLMLMKVTGNVKVATLLAAALFIAGILLGSVFVQADYKIPETIKVGLSHGSTANNNFTIKSTNGITVNVLENGVYKSILTFMDANGIKVRKDAYYNIIEGVTTEINYIKAVAYKGEVIGPYHIQVGEPFATFEEAKQLASIIESTSPSVFLAYDAGWRVWTQLYVDDSACTQQIEVLKNEHPDYTYYVVYPDKRRVQLLDPISGKVLFVLNAEQPVKVDVIPKEGSASIIEYGVSKYRGSILFVRLAEGDINVINELQLEEYLYGVVPREMPASWHIEALKAQAVASRCYAIRNVGRHSAQGFDMCNGQHCQVYLGYSGEHANTSKAINETKGKVIVHNNSIISAYFSSTSGGYTENSENYWSAVLPYIRGVDDSYEKSPYSNWEKLFNKDEVKAKLAARNVDIGEIVNIIPRQVSEFGRVIKLEIVGTKDKKIYEKENIRVLFGYNDLKSTWFTVKTDADVYVRGAANSSPQVQTASELNVISASGISKLSSSTNTVAVKSSSSVKSYNIVPNAYTFNGKGYGHGLGMSQYGAKGMAEAGFNYIQILEHYFSDTKVQ